ncbi:MAG: WecB/TagA/CpsF family glycosyltransferase [Anaerolineae bacterium]
MLPRRIDILGVGVDDVTPTEALDILTAWIDARRPRRVVTPNPEMVMLARRDPAFAGLLADADLAVPDGVGLLWASRLRGTPLRALVPGSDLVPWLAERSAGRGDRWFLLGAAEGVAEEAGRRLAARYPGLCVAGAFAGDASALGDPETRAAVRAAGRVDVLLVAYGAPRQEAWMARNLDLDVPVAIGVGGTLNFIAGRSPTPPRWVYNLGLGWAYRLITEPWRWRRQIVLPQFAALAVWDALRQRTRP